MDLKRIPVESIRRSLAAKAETIDIHRMARKGANGYVFFGHHRILEQARAIKYYYWGGVDRYHAEPRLLASIASAHVAEIFHAEMVDAEWALFETPYYDHGDVQDLLDSARLSMHEALDLTADVVRGINDLHSAGMIHRDLKPENVFLSGALRGVIGDFGSVKRLPEDEDSVSGSGHSVIFRPPESCERNIYGKTGDIYQAGLLCYQLVGGSLPYDDVSWLGKGELKIYRQITDPVEQRIFADTVIKRKIASGRVIRIASVEPWVPEPVRRFLRKATNRVPSVRFETSASMLVALHGLRARVPNWRREGDRYVMSAKNVRRRVVPIGGDTFRVERPRGAGWQKDGAFTAGEPHQLLAALNSQYLM